MCTEAEFLDVIGTKPSEFSSLLSQLNYTNGPPPPPPFPGAKVINVNIVYRNLKSENSQDYAQKPQRNCMFMNSASVLVSEVLYMERCTISHLHCTDVAMCRLQIYCIQIECVLNLIFVLVKGVLFLKHFC